jgi:hypothetical protein
VVVSIEKNFFGAVLKGLRTSQAEFVAVVMADCCDNLPDLDRMFKMAEEEEMCIVCGERSNHNTESFIKTFSRLVVRKCL